MQFDVNIVFFNFAIIFKSNLVADLKKFWTELLDNITHTNVFTTNNSSVCNWT